MVSAALDAFAALLTGQRYYLTTHDHRAYSPESVDPEDVYDLPRLPAPSDSNRKP